MKGKARTFSQFPRDAKYNDISSRWKKFETLSERTCACWTQPVDWVSRGEHIPKRTMSTHARAGESTGDWRARGVCVQRGVSLFRSHAVINKSVNGVSGLMSAVTPNVRSHPYAHWIERKRWQGKRGETALRWNFVLFVLTSVDAETAEASSVKRQRPIYCGNCFPFECVYIYIYMWAWNAE